MKKIFFNVYMKGNMEALIDYFNKEINDPNIQIIYKNKYNLRNSKVKNIIIRLYEYMFKYDLVISDYSTTIYKKGKKGIFMSHGYGTKNTPGNEEIDRKKTMNSYRMMRNNVDYLITLSKRDEEYFWKHPLLEGSKEPKYLPLGLPRNDILFNSDYIKENNKKIREKLNLNKKILLYCPTWRGYEYNYDEIFNEEKLNIIDKYCEEKGWVFLFRPHYLESIIKVDLIKKFKNLIVVDVEKEPDTQKLLCAVDILLTDYSSIYIDYLITNRPVAFFGFDQKEYQEYRGLAIDYNNNEHVPGPKLKDITEIIDYIETIEVRGDNFEEYREKAQKLFYEYLDGDTCKRIWKLIYDII